MAILSRKILQDKYEIVREIKQGGFGVVYYGVDRTLNKPIAIKEIAPGLLEDPKYLDMFQEEAKNIAKLSHHNIVHIYEFLKTPDGSFYIIMEYIDGVDLERLMRLGKRVNKPLPHLLAVYTVAEVCIALDYAHHRRDTFTNKPLNLVHLDISPSNIMVSRDGNVKLIDFGIALVRRHQTKEEREHQVRGKIPYMSPEQLVMGNHPDHRSDLYALGLVLYEAVSGVKLFRSRQEIIAATKNKKHVKKALKGKNLPSALDKIITKALEPDISQRYQSANHMYIDLVQYLLSRSAGGELMDQLIEYVADLREEEKLLRSGNHPMPSTPPSDFEASPLKPDSQSDGGRHSLAPRWEPPESEEPRPMIPETFDRPGSSPVVSEERAASRSSSYTSEFDDDEENMKTIIDGVRIYARDNKRGVLYGAVAALLLAAAWLALDTWRGWTGVGLAISDWLFPPAIEIVTVPPNAKIILDGESVNGRTPLAINEISPGVHKLELTLPGYKPIVKSLFVPRDGDIRVRGNTNGSNSRQYVFRFNADIALNSNPPNAAVYFNGVRLNQRTPCTISWEVGLPLEIEMEHPGYERLTGFRLHTLEGYEEVEDRRFWQMAVQEEPHLTYTVHGVFRKRVEIETAPEGVEVRLANGDGAIAVTGQNNVIYLIAGEHELIFRKNNFISRSVNVTIDETFDEAIRVVLSRRVRFSAYDAREPGRDLGATVISLTRNGQRVLNAPRTTPFDLVLPAYSHVALVQKSGYESRRVVVGPEEQTVRVPMEPTLALVQVAVVHAITSLPIREAEVYYRTPGAPEISETRLGRTDVRGELNERLPEGQYTVLVRAPGYRESQKTLRTALGETYNMVFKIYPAN